MEEIVELHAAGRIELARGMIAAYGAFVDNGTNDPAYVAANLAATN